VLLTYCAAVMPGVILQLASLVLVPAQEQASALVRQLAEYTITLKELEDNLLFRLANAQVGEELPGQLQAQLQPCLVARRMPCFRP